MVKTVKIISSDKLRELVRSARRIAREARSDDLTKRNDKYWHGYLDQNEEFTDWIRLFEVEVPEDEVKKWL